MPDTAPLLEKSAEPPQPSPVRTFRLVAGYLLLVLGLVIALRTGAAVDARHLVETALGLFISVAGGLVARQARGTLFTRVEWCALGGAALYLLYFLATTLFNRQTAAVAMLPPAAWAFIAPITAVLYLLILVSAIRMIARLDLGRGVEAVLMCGALVLYLAINPVAIAVLAHLYRGFSLEQIFVAMDAASKLHPPLTIEILAPFMLIVTGAFFGQLLARLIREPAMLVPVGIVASMVDFWGVLWGTMHTLSQNPVGELAMNAIGSAPTAAPAIPQDVVSQMPQGLLKIAAQVAPPSNIGLGDFVFLAFFLTCAFRLGFSPRRTMWGIFTGLLISSFLIAFAGQTVFGVEMPHFDYLPGLPFICGGALLANLRTWRLTRQEWLMTAAVVVALAIPISFNAYYNLTTRPPATEQAGPDLTRFPHFSLRADAGPVMAAAALDALAKETPRSGLVLVAGRCKFVRAADAAQMRECNLFVLDRHKADTLEDFGEYMLLSGNIPAGARAWSMAKIPQRPPRQTLAILTEPLRAKGQKITRNEAVTLLRHTPGLPPAVFAALAQAQDYAKLFKPHEEFYLRIRPTGVTILDSQLHEVKRGKG